MTRIFDARYMVASRRSIRTWLTRLPERAGAAPGLALPGDFAVSSPSLLDPHTRSFLLASARHALSLELGLDVSPPEPVEDPSLDERARVFVSWHHGEALVGCLGTLEARSPLLDAVRYFAVAAGLHDPRTAAASASDVPGLRCEISVLGESHPLAARGCSQIARRLEPGADGVVLRSGSRRAVFLPVVWKSLPEPAAFLAALCKKAGIDDPEQSDPPLLAETFRVESFDDSEAHDGAPGRRAE